jgi:predicted ester cyclase
VVDRWTFSGTHSGEFMGAPATGKRVTVSGIDIFRVADGRLAELWQSWDQLGMMQQIGA